MKNKSFIVILCLAMLSCQKESLNIDTIEKKSLSKLVASIKSDVNTYYIDNVNGNDGYNGKSIDSAWKNISKVNSTIFSPGDKILFRSGGSWTNQLQPQGSGTINNPISIGKYGTGDLPKINGAGVANGTIYLNNQQYWEITDLEITNYNAAEENGISLSVWEANNTSNYANVDLPAQAVRNNTFKFGVLITANDIGAVKHIQLKNLLIHGVNGAISQANESTKDNGGVGFIISGNVTPTWFDGVLMENCVIRDVDRTGVFNKSSWDNRTFTSNDNWTPSVNVIFRNNTFKNIGANALIVRVADRPLMEHNLFDYCAIKGSGNAAFNFNTDYAKWQYNECRFTKANQGDRDAGGLDSDYRTKNTIIQYNYIHDNDFGLLVTGGAGNFNDNTQVKYNIIERDGLKAHPSHGKFVIKVAGGATNTVIYNNTIYVGSNQSAINVITHTEWSVWPKNTSYYNNVFYNEVSNGAVSLGSSSGNVFENNMIRVNRLTKLDNIKTGDIKFVQVNTNPDGYKLKIGSGAINAGKVISGNGGKDYFGNSVSPVNPPNLGAYNGIGL